MSKKPAPKPDDPEQSKRFLETAKEVEAEDDPQSFDRAFKSVSMARTRLAEKARKQL